MGRVRSTGLWWAVAIVSAGVISACGGHRAPGQPSSPAKITLSPSGSTSLQAGSTLIFTASAQTGASRSVSAAFTYASSDTSILNVAPNGVACAGHWDAAYTTCTPGAIGIAQVTASALGATSVPTFVFVHPPIDNLTVTGVLQNGVPIQEPCLSQGQTMTVEAHAFSQGSDVTASVGPFTWSANNSSVVKLTPLVNPAYNFATNQATATAVTPGVTQIFASASSVSSSSFRQPQYTNSQGTSPVLDFFETCPIQNIALELGHAGSGQTSFAISKGTSETVIATVTDVMGNSSLPNSNGGIVLSKIPLTWTSSQPAAVAAGTGCQQSCALTTPSPGAAAVTASCSPPTCNIGFPEVPASLSTPAALAACAQFFRLNSCQQFIPLPVYASPLPNKTTAVISGVVNGTTSSATVLATSLGCSDEPPADCTTAVYSVSTSRASAGIPTPMPTPPNSLLFDLAGDKAYMGSAFGAQVINAANVGTGSAAFTALGTVTGKVLAVSTNGTVAVFSDTLHVPNQVYVVNTAGSSSTALNIAGASVAAFSPDGLKAFIFGFDSNNNPNLYVYSVLQALQVIGPLPAGTTVNSIAFSTNGAFAYAVEPSLGGGGPAFTVFNTCDNQVATSPSPSFTPQVFSLSATPVSFKALPDGVHFLALESNGTLEYITASITGITAATPTQPATSLCPMFVEHVTPLQKIDLGQGSIHPINFFASADGTLLYVLASDRSSVLVYNFSTGAVTGIELAGNATPVSADMSVDGGTILIAGSDGLLHQVSTALGGSDQVQLAFLNLPNFLNPFCTITPASGACTLDFVAVKP
jgi:hypothetical protein